MAVISQLLLLMAVSLCITRAENNETFIFGFPLPYLPHLSKAMLHITTASSTNISYTVTISGQLVSRGSVNGKQDEEIELQQEIFAVNSSFQNRHKAIIVEAAGSISIVAYSTINYKSTIGGFNVIPYTRYPTLTEYRYYGVSVRSRPQNSLMLLVGSDNNTKVTVKPSVDINLPVDIQQDSDLIQSIKAGTSYSFTLHRGQTLLLKTPNDDISGTEIIANKPLTVISGHECANVPENVGGCDQILAHIPPTVTWGKNFILQPFAGRTAGQLIKIISAENDTILQHDCTDDSITATKLSGGDRLEFDSSSFKACLVQSNKPIMVAQFGKGGSIDELGDPTLMIVTPVEQYTPQRVSFKGRPATKEWKQYANVIVPAQNFNRTLVHLNHKQLECDWAIVYAMNSTSDIVAYTCTVHITTNDIHIVVSKCPSALMVYGFFVSLSSTDSARRQGYAYSMNREMLPLNAVIRVKFMLNQYKVNESDGYVMVEIWRMDSVPVEAQVLVKTESGTALSGYDFNATQEMLTFNPGKSHKSIRVPIINDEWMEDTEEFKIIVQPLGVLSSSFVNYATIEIQDDDDLKIGFSTHPDSDGKMGLQVGTFSGRLQPGGPPALVHLKIQFLTSDMDSLYSEQINITHNLTSTNIKCGSLCDSENKTIPSTVIGLLELVDSERVNKTRIKLSPSFTLITVVPTASPSPPPYIGHTQPPASALPVIMTQPTKTASPSMELIIIVGFVSSVTTLIFAILIGMFGCYLSYKYGKEYGYRYQYFKPVRSDRNAIETKSFFVQSVTNV